MENTAERKGAGVYDRRLDSIIAAADCGSFSKAAKQLGVSTPALAKRIDTFEADCGIALFNRTRRGVFLTPAGASIVEDARAIMRQSEDVLRRAREQEAFGGTTVRLGISAACPARAVLEAWPRVHEADSSLHLELVPIGDVDDADLGVVEHLGGSVDLVEVPGVSVDECAARWGGVCRVEALPPSAVPSETCAAPAISPEAYPAPAACAVLLFPRTPSSATRRFVELLLSAAPRE